MGAAKRHGQPSVAADLVGAAEKFGFSLSSEQFATFNTYVETLLLWAERLSLTATRSAHEIASRHICDSFSVVPWLAAGVSVADLGSGAGFPGVPLAVARPDLRVLLVEPRRKRANFLREVVRRCRLANTVVVEERAEDFAAGNPECVDVTVSRAVWALTDFLIVSAVLLRAGGLAIAMKGPTVRTAIATHEHFTDPQLSAYSLPMVTEHILVIYRRR